MSVVRLLCRLFAVCSALGILLHRPVVKQPPKIAIIGGGIGGGSAAHFLSDLVSEKIQIDLYEAKELGGRIATTVIDGRIFEVGGTVIHPRNKYMNYFRKKFGLSKLVEDSEGVIALYDGTEFPFIGSTWQIISLIKMVWRYGKSVARSLGMVDQMLGKFDRIYEWQEMSKAFADMKSMIAAMSPTFIDYLNKTTKQGFMEQGLNERFVNEIVRASTKCNYGQNINIHQFVGSVSLAGIQPGLWSVEGGNKQIVAQLVNDSRAAVIFKEVVKVELHSDETFTVHTEDTSKNYDVVIVATPLTSDAKLRVKFTGFPNEIKLNGKYHRTVATIVHGRINYKYFAFDSEHSFPNLILSVGDTFFNSLGKISPVKSSAEHINIWKVFSSVPLNNTELDKLFMERYDTQVFDWLAYPHYTTYDIFKTNDSFVLHPGLFYVSAVEWAASAMEMSIISGRNAALLAYKSLFPYEYSQLQTHEKIQDIHEEL